MLTHRAESGRAPARNGSGQLGVYAPNLIYIFLCMRTGNGTEGKNVNRGRGGGSVNTNYAELISNENEAVLRLP